jgi:hypothetical protein
VCFRIAGMLNEAGLRSRNLRFPQATAIGVDFGPHCHAPGHMQQPAGQRARPTDGAALARQDEKSRLERVLRIVPIPQNTPAQPQDDGSMPPYELSESRFFMVNQELLE